MQPKYKVILKTLAGSRLYGMAMPESDVDYRGVAIQEIKDLMNPFQHFEQHIETIETDLTIWNVDKFFHLAEQNNPNIIELLFANDHSIIEITDEGEVKKVPLSLAVNKMKKD